MSDGCNAYSFSLRFVELQALLLVLIAGDVVVAGIAFEVVNQDNLYGSVGAGTAAAPAGMGPAAAVVDTAAAAAAAAVVDTAAAAAAAVVDTVAVVAVAVAAAAAAAHVDIAAVEAHAAVGCAAAVLARPLDLHSRTAAGAAADSVLPVLAAGVVAVAAFAARTAAAPSLAVSA